MRITSTAVALFAAAQATTAFVPGGSFGVRRIGHDVTALRSTTVKDEDLFRNLAMKNGALQSEISEIMSSSSSQATTSSEALEIIATRKAKAVAADYLSQYQNQSGAAIVYSKLQENGVKVVNGYSGGAVLPLLDQFHEDNPRHKDSPLTPIRWITNSNESSAGHIAEGYAKSMPIDPDNLPVGVVVATSGPGVTNLITPLQDAICDGVPMVVLCGQAATTAPADAFQSAPAVAMTAPCTKWSYQIKSAAEIPFVMDYAFYVARNGRPGPVFVDLPKDLQNQILTPDLLQGYVNSKLPENADLSIGMASLETHVRENGEIFKAFRLGTEQDGLAFDVIKSAEGPIKLGPVPNQNISKNHIADHQTSNKVIYTAKALTGEPNKTTTEGELSSDSRVFTTMVDFIKRARKPVIIAGQGCNDCPEDLKEFAEKLQIPVTTTLHALGSFDERNPLALNMMGMHGHPTPNFMVQESDLIICIGSRFDDRITGRMSDFVPAARKAAELGTGGVIHVDLRLTEMGKQIEPTFFVHSTGKNFLQTVNAALDRSYGLTPLTGEWLQRKNELQAEYPITIPTYARERTVLTDAHGRERVAERTRMSAQRVITEMNNQILAAGKMDDAIFTTGVGIHQMVTAQLITWTQPRQMLSSGSLGTMGVSLGYSVGAKLANGAKLVIAVDGDGSFNMTFTELKTVAEQNIPVKIIILDNESQMMVEYWQRLFHDARYLAVRNSKNPDYSTLASAFGIRSIYCDTEDKLASKMKEFLFDYPDEPVLFHVRIERTPCLPLVAPGQPLDDMILEDVNVDVDQSAAPS